MCIFGLIEALLAALKKEMKDPLLLHRESIKISRLLDYFAISSFETFIKGREDLILRQTDEITEILTPVIQVWEGYLPYQLLVHLTVREHKW